MMKLLLQQSVASLKSSSSWCKHIPNSHTVYRFSTNFQTLASCFSAKEEENDLYQRLIQCEPINDVSVAPVIDQWVVDGKPLEYDQLTKAVKHLRSRRCFSHALQIYEWINNSEQPYLSPKDVSAQLDLISKVHGLEAAEKFFASISDNLRAPCVYGSLLNCYASAKSLKKAEGTMQKLRDLGAVIVINYNVMMNLYVKLGDLEKMHSLVQEMKDKGITGDAFSYTIRLNAYASAPDVKEMENLLMKMEADPLLLDWNAYAVAAKCYIKAGNVEKASEVLKKFENLKKVKNLRLANEVLLALYASIRKKDGVYRMWNRLNRGRKVYNTSYLCMISGLERLDDIDGVEKMFAEWEANKVYFDIRVPNSLIAIYCRKGRLEKAESVIERLLDNGKEPNYNSWNHLLVGYCSHNQMEKAVETLKKAILASASARGKPQIDSWVPCVAYLRSIGDAKREEEIKRLLEELGIFSAAIGNGKHGLRELDDTEELEEAGRML